MSRHVRVAIIGGGPAGLTAAIYAARANLKTAVFMGIEHTSQMFTTTDVENFPSHKAIKGPELMNAIQEQAEHCGAELLYEDVQTIDVTAHPFKIKHGYGDEVTLTDSLIIATGANARRLDPKGEKEYWQKGVSACAVCDSMMAKGTACVVVGGGDVACEEANYLSNIATNVLLVLRRDKFRASAAMVKKVLANKKITVVYDSAVEEIKGDGKSVTEVVIKNLKDQKLTTHKVGALYWAVGHDPQTSFVKGTPIRLDEAGYIELVAHPSQQTSVPGVFAAGDCCDHTYRQAIVAAGSGSRAALDAERWLAMQE